MVIPRWRVGFPRVTHPFATRVERNKFPSRRVRLACIRHAASVHPEPGSNSHERSWVSIDSKIFTSFCFFNWLPPTTFRIYRCSNLRWTLSHLVCLSLFSFQWAFVASKKQLLYNNKVNLRSQHFFQIILLLFFFVRFLNDECKNYITTSYSRSQYLYFNFIIICILLPIFSLLSL